LPISILNFEAHGPPKHLWATVRRTGCTPLSGGLSTDVLVTSSF